MNHQTHVILVSAQPPPNITPMLDREIQPENVIMAVSGDMKQRADWLDDVLKPRGIRTVRWGIEDPYDYEQMQEFFLNRLADLPAADLALNVTGGTKLMAIAAYHAFSAASKAIYYVHPESDRLIWLYPTKRDHHNLENRVKLEHFFMAHGARLLPGNAAFGVREDLFDLSQELVSQVDKYQNALKTLNRLIEDRANKRTLRSDPVPREIANRDDFESLVHCFGSRNLVRWDKNFLLFESEEDRFFVNGGWLELYVFRIAGHLQRKSLGMQDAGRGLKLIRSRQKADALNEFEVAFLADNRLYVIECKTGSFTDAESDKAANVLFKLNTLSEQFGGIQAKKMLVSYQELPVSIKQRAATDRIEICAGTQLQTLEDRLIKWIRQ